MDKYIINLLPRLKQYGQKLNKIESFVDKTWVLYNSNGAYQTFRFKRGGKLIISTDGLVDECSWEYHAPDGLQINQSGKKGIMYRHAFFLESLFIMQIEGAIFQPVLFFNEAVIPDGNVIRYLKNIYVKKFNLHPIGNGGKYFYDGHSTFGLVKGVRILNDEFESVGTKNIKVDNKEIKIVNGVIQDIIYTYKMQSDLGILFFRSKSIIDSITPVEKGCEVRLENNNLAHGSYKIYNEQFIKRIEVKNGVLTKVVEKIDYFDKFIQVAFFTLIISTIIALLLHYFLNK